VIAVGLTKCREQLDAQSGEAGYNTGHGEVVMRTEDKETDDVEVRAPRPAASKPRRTARLGARFTAQERQVLGSLRDRYQQGRDQFSQAELARLRFVRWLVQSGQIDC
jgi:hypothetical protein